jgi:putative Mg2+ transporter-C (MgtC) family protein
MEPFLLELHVLGQCLAALLLGGIIGWERQKAGKWAGLRTHMLVCLSAMLFIRTGEFLVIHASGFESAHILQMDPTRIIEAIVTGVAFIGAGTVFRDRSKNFARGLTTAASLLAVAPVGIAVAVDRYVTAVGVTLIIYLVLHHLGKLERSRLTHPPEET